MKNNSTILFTILVTLALLTAVTSIGSGSNETQKTFSNASVLGWETPTDTSDMTVQDYKDEIARLKREIKKLKKDKFHFHFDSDEFKEDMKGLTIELDKLKDKSIHFNFDAEDFNERMQELSDELKSIKIKCDFDTEKFNKEMKELSIKLKEHPIIAGGFDFDFDLDLDKLSIELGDLKVELKKLESFLKELKSEMKNDGLIDDVEEDVDLEFNKDQMKVNGEPVTEELHQKYIDIYEKHFDKSIEDGFSIRSH